MTSTMLRHDSEKTRHEAPRPVVAPPPGPPAWNAPPPRVPIPAERAAREGWLLKDNAYVQDTWSFADDGGLDGRDVVVPLQRFLIEGHELRARPFQVGVQLQPTDDVRALRGKLDGVSLIVLSIAKFRDGRAYSQARLLRDDLGYTGPLRVRGVVVVDQVWFLRRVGFDEIELRKDEDVDVARRALKSFTYAYQPSSDEGRPLWRLIRRGAL